MEIAKRVLQWRWLVIDEECVGSVRLLADVDMKLREVVRRIDTGKLDGLGADRQFGGLNVICFGDM